MHYTQFFMHHTSIQKAVPSLTFSSIEKDDSEEDWLIELEADVEAEAEACMQVHLLFPCLRDLD
jgi:hypothetical protein